MTHDEDEHPRTVEHDDHQQDELRRRQELVVHHVLHTPGFLERLMQEAEAGNGAAARVVNDYCRALLRALRTVERTLTGQSAPQGEPTATEHAPDR